ncbi:hypothetical protein C1645_807883 [Glomus cerebriforme]|uniref:MIR domain-containing protein n=1 Tax=Glomus cerebriforme TaxID=658196 RepID=A0A397SJ14_9GLOM|nr:hypothetical protein C1645_807883 [Glomus cerebriforme]
MELEMYDRTVHPEVWLEKVKSYCYLKNIITDENILKFCKTLIHPSINVTEATSFIELIKILKSDHSFESYKNSSYRKLKNLQFKQFIQFNHNNSANENEILKFLTDFHQLCYEAEIKEFEEQKKLFLETLPIHSIQRKFIVDNLEKINSMKELMKYFDQSLLLKEITYGYRVALKHVASGKYLSSSDVIHYKTGSKNRIVFAGQTFLVPDALWFITKSTENESYILHNHEPVSYGKSFALISMATPREMLGVDNNFQSPVTHFAEATLLSTYDKRTQLIATNSINNNTDNYIQSGDIITLKNSDNYILRSHERTFTIDNKTYQEVIGHNERTGGNDEWCIELVNRF